MSLRRIKFKDGPLNGKTAAYFTMGHTLRIIQEGITYYYSRSSEDINTYVYSHEELRKKLA